MSLIRINIDRLVLNGFGALEGQALAEAFQSQLSRGLADPGSRQDWARRHHTPVLRLGRIMLAAGKTGASSFGKQMGRAVTRGLKP